MAMNVRFIFAICGLSFLMASSSNSSFAESKYEQKPSHQNAVVYIVSPQDGQKLKSPVTIVFGLKAMGVAPAGINLPNTGHHHLLIDSKLPSLKQPIPANEKSIHFGAGQTETSVELKPGKHTLQLLLGDANHFPHLPAVYSKKIEIEVLP